MGAITEGMTMFVSDREVIDRMGELIARDNRVVSDHDVLWP